MSASSNVALTTKNVVAHKLNITLLLEYYDSSISFSDELLYHFKLSKPSIVFTTSEFYDKVEDVQRECDFLRYLFDVDTIPKTESNINDFQYSIDGKVKSTDIALILYTSGSTGCFKGVMFSHKAMIIRLEWNK